MSLKTSFFNKSIFKSDIKRFWWISVLETLLLVAACVIPVYEECSNRRLYNSFRGYEPTWMDGAVAITWIFAVGVAVLLFSYLHGSSSVSGYHCLPIKRKALFFTKIKSGLFLTLMPIVICGACMALFLKDPVFRECYNVIDVLKWIVSGFLYTAILFSLTALVNQFTGNSVATLVFTYGFAALPVIFINFFDAFFYRQLYGYVNYSGNIINYIYANEEALVTFNGFAIYFATAVAFTAGAYFLYKKRKLEMYGEVISFSWLKPVFIGIVAILASMLSYLYFSGIFGIYSVWLLLPVGIIGTVIAWMISRKSLSPKGILKPVLIYFAITSCFCLAVEFDITGFETRVPELSNVESASITHDSNERTRIFDGEEVTFTHPGKITPEFTEEKDIINVINLHKNMIEKHNNTGDQHIPVEYKLKNGKTLKRQYYVSFEAEADALAPLYETKQLRAKLYPVIDGGERSYNTIEIHDRRLKSPMFITRDNDEMNKLIEALKADTSSIPYKEMTVTTGSSVKVRMFYNNHYTFSHPLTDYDKDSVESDSSEYSIRPSFKNTVDLLTEMGFYDSLPKAEDIEGATIKVWKDSTLETADTKESTESGASTVDPTEIKALYAEYDNMIETKKYSDYSNKLNVLITFRIRGTGHTFDVSCSYDEDKIPEIFKKYF